jgi:hypothetical protein
MIRDKRRTTSSEVSPTESSERIVERVDRHSSEDLNVKIDQPISHHYSRITCEPHLIKDLIRTPPNDILQYLRSEIKVIFALRQFADTSYSDALEHFVGLRSHGR